jgi:hypothetical protein
MKCLLHNRERTSSRIAASPIILFAGLMTLSLVPRLSAQVNIQGVIKPHGVVNMRGQAGVHQYTHIWAFSPPNGTDGVHDNSYFKTNVLTGNSYIDGASLIVAWSSIEITAPTTTPCGGPPSDQCQPDPGAPGWYHNYSWSSYYDTTTGTTPVYQWLQVSGKKINLLIAGEDGSGTTNSTTPYYVTSPAWYDQFNPQQQDVINAVANTACSSVPWMGTVSTSASYASGQVTVNSTGCCAAGNESATIQNGDTVWVNASPAACGTSSSGTQATVSGSSSFSYTPNASGSCTGAPTSVTFISPSESWSVPYELPYMSALKAFWAAVVAHYGSNFKLPAGMGTNYYSQLNYFRFGGSVGSEWYPYCISGMPSSGPYAYSETAWLNYYLNMGNYLQSLGPPWRVIHSINAATTTPASIGYGYATQEAAYAVTWSNRFGVRDGFGSQGLSMQDDINCTGSNSCNPGPPYSASNWYPLFLNYNAYGVPLELQTIALSYPGDTTCTTPYPIGCTPNTYAGDLPSFLPFATTAGATDFEIYWRDLSLAYDVNNYCSLSVGACNSLQSITPGSQINPSTLQYTFFQDVGQGNTNPYCSGNLPQSGATGNCEYQNYLDSAHGQH